MEYKVLYRKYRPIDFKSIIGQDYTINMLKNSIIHDKISHAYLFTGPRGTGKTSTAKVFAKTINCEHLVDGEACGKCGSCLNFSNSPDIIEIDAASNNGVDDIRELINNIKIAPSESRFKIYIIDEVHMMTQSAFNALLLTLEEPPAHAIFIMATTNVESVPITILSRCQRFNFQKISLNDLQKQIKYVCSEENIDITDEAIEEIAYLSEGGMRDALSLLDQLSSNGEQITLEKILHNYGSISSLFIKNLISSIEKNDVDSVINSIRELEGTSSDYKVFIKKLINELVINAVKIKENPTFSRLTYEDVKDMIFDLNDCMNRVSIHVSPFSLIQVILLKYVKFSQVVTQKKENVDNLLKNGQDIEKNNDFIQDSNPELDNKHENVQVNTDSEQENLNINEDIYTDSEEYEDYLNELKNVRINNCFALAQKSALLEYQAKLQSINGNIDIKPDIISLLVDIKVVAASKEIIVLSSKMDSIIDLINHRIEEIESELSILFSNYVSFIAVTMEEWKNMKQEYIQNIKNGVKYEIIDESGIQELKPQLNDSQLKKVASTLFDEEKIRVI